MYELFMVVAGGHYRCIAIGSIELVAKAQFVLWMGGVNSYMKEV